MRGRRGGVGAARAGAGAAAGQVMWRQEQQQEQVRWPSSAMPHVTHTGRDTHRSTYMHAHIQAETPTAAHTRDTYRQGHPPQHLHVTHTGRDTHRSTYTHAHRVTHAHTHAATQQPANPANSYSLGMSNYPNWLPISSRARTHTWPPGRPPTLTPRQAPPTPARPPTHTYPLDFGLNVPQLLLDGLSVQVPLVLPPLTGVLVLQLGQLPVPVFMVLQRDAARGGR